MKLRNTNTLRRISVLFWLRSFTVLSLLLSTHFLIAQSVYTTNTFRVSKLTLDEGLSQATNYFTYKDSQGFLWITANDAINRYDGKYVKVFQKEKYFNHCQPLSQGYNFAEDKYGNIYIGSINGLYIYNRSNDQFTNEKLFRNESDNSTIPFAFHDNKIWCYNRQYHLVAFDVDTKQRQFFNDIQIDSIESLHIYSLENNWYAYRQPFFDKNGKLWIVSKNNLVQYDVKKRQCRYLLADLFPQKPTDFISCWYHEQKNLLLLGTPQGVVTYNLLNKERIAYPFKKPLMIRPLGNGYCILSDFFTITDSVFSTSTVLDPARIKQGMLNSNIVLNSNENNLVFLREDGVGLYILNFDQQLLQKELGTTVDGSSLFKSSVQCLGELPDGAILVVSNPHVYIKKSASEALQPLIGTDHINIDRIFTDTLRKGVWMSCYSNQRFNELRFYDGITHRFSDRHVKISKDSTGLLMDLAILPDGALIGAFGKGLFRIDADHHTVHKYDVNLSGSAFKISILSRQRIAVSFLNNSMRVYKISYDSRQLVEQNSILPGLNSFYVQEDTRNSRYWVGAESGVYLLDANFKKTHQFNVNNGLSGNYIYGLLSDNQGNIWVSHQSGLSTIDARNFHIVNYTKSDGLQDLDFNNRCFLKSASGTLYFGGKSGYNFISAPLVNHQLIKPEVYVNEIVVDTTDYHNGINANLIDRITVSYKNTSVTVAAIIKSLPNADDYQIAYRLAADNSIWTYLPNNSSIILNKLKPGSYQLEIGYKNRFSNEVVIQKRIELNITAPFYRQSWFWVLIAITGTAAGFWLFYRIKIRREELRAIRNQMLENQRQKITADLHDELGSALSSLQINSAIAHKLMQNQPQEAIHIIEKIEKQSQSLAETMSDFIWSIKPAHQTYSTISNRIKNFAADIIGSTDINYVLEIDEAIDQYITDFSLRKNIILISKEAINNAVKYSSASCISIRLQLKDLQIHLAITDDGIGLQPDRNQGNGISNMQKRAAENGGVLHIHTPKDGGTCIEVIIPLP